MSEENTEDLFSDRFSLLGRSLLTYKRPVLGPSLVNFLKKICDYFQYDMHVFAKAIEVIEDYTREKRDRPVKEPVLMAVTAIFMCHNSEGAAGRLKIARLQRFLLKFHGKFYRRDEITAMEDDILHALGGRPVVCVVDDLDLVIHKYARRLQAGLRPVCLRILELVLVRRAVWLKELRQIYFQNADLVILFYDLCTCRFTLPIGVLLAAIYKTRRWNVISIDEVLGSVSQISQIDADHFRLFLAKIIETLNSANMEFS